MRIAVLCRNPWREWYRAELAARGHEVHAAERASGLPACDAVVVDPVWLPAEEVEALRAICPPARWVVDVDKYVPEPDLQALLAGTGAVTAVGRGRLVTPVLADYLDSGSWKPGLLLEPFFERKREAVEEDRAIEASTIDEILERADFVESLAKWLDAKRKRKERLNLARKTALIAARDSHVLRDAGHFLRTPTSEVDPKALAAALLAVGLAKQAKAVTELLALAKKHGFRAFGLEDDEADSLPEREVERIGRAMELDPEALESALRSYVRANEKSFKPSSPGRSAR